MPLGLLKPSREGSPVLVVSFEASLFGTNCYVLATAAGQECVVVDPGIGVLDQLDEVLREHRVRPVAVLLTHGHIDHVFSVTPVCGARGIPAYVHPDDRYRLVDPIASLGPIRDALAAMGGPLTWTEPDDVRPLRDGEAITLAGLDLTVDHAPGHTEGSVLFRTTDSHDVGTGERAPVCVSGDVLFAGSIGRSDLPGGDPAAMQESLRTKVLPLVDETVVLPGHGPATTIGRERATNPYLHAAAASGSAGRSQ
jgi:hydroxyacylglutathione hydrolase